MCFGYIIKKTILKRTNPGCNKIETSASKPWNDYIFTTCHWASILFKCLDPSRSTLSKWVTMKKKKPSRRGAETSIFSIRAFFSLSLNKSVVNIVLSFFLCFFSLSFFPYVFFLTFFFLSLVWSEFQLRVTFFMLWIMTYPLLSKDKQNEMYNSNKSNNEKRRCK